MSAFFFLVWFADRANFLIDSLQCISHSIAYTIFTVELSLAVVALNIVAHAVATLDFSRVRFIDSYLATTPGAHRNFLFRTNEPVAANNSTFQYAELSSMFRKVAATAANLTLPKNFFLIDVK